MAGGIKITPNAQLLNIIVQQAGAELKLRSYPAAQEKYWWLGLL
jgi:hypothetical protein